MFELHRVCSQRILNLPGHHQLFCATVFVLVTFELEDKWLPVHSPIAQGSNLGRNVCKRLFIWNNQQEVAQLLIDLVRTVRAGANDAV